MNAFTTILTASCLSLASCTQDTSGDARRHDTLFNKLEIGSDVCILDSETQLVWQSKSPQAGLNAAENTYSWFDPNEANGELDYRGLQDGGKCVGSACDTWHYVEAVNQSEYCGHSDWRMPSKDELFSISDMTRVDTPPTIDTAYFPDTKAAEYWSGNDYSFQYDAAWCWNFELGHDRVDWKKEPKFVRLVRGQAMALNPVKE